MVVTSTLYVFHVLFLLVLSIYKVFITAEILASPGTHAVLAGGPPPGHCLGILTAAYFAILWLSSTAILCHAVSLQSVFRICASPSCGGVLSYF